MARSTTVSVWRSNGGDQTRTSTAGSMMMSASFYISATATAGTNVYSDSTMKYPVILPVGAVVTSVLVAGAATGGTSPTFDLGTKGYVSGTANTTGLVNGAPASSNSAVLFGATDAGTELGFPVSTTELVYVTGGAGASAPTGGTVSGLIVYTVADNGAESN